MRSRSFFALLFFLLASAPSAAGEEEWRYRIDGTARLNVAGYEPSMIFSNDGRERVVAADISPLLMDYRARVRVYTSVLHIEIEPYTVVPRSRFYVSAAGLVWNVFVPVGDRVRLGLHHHSSHNFSEGKYGGGTSINALAGELKLLDDELSLFGQTFRYRAKIFGHWYVSATESPYVFTSQANVASADIDDVEWRSGADFEGMHRFGRTECGIRVAGPRGPPASVRGSCDLKIAPGRAFLGSFGDRVYVGPYVAAGANFLRHWDFGVWDFVAGIAVTGIAAENTW